ncbi:MAG: hypothetical protein EPN26_10250 [Rhodospirillales bacterium]|nr:MAG: hypothetical protein EPN26_10250 [Rhodospirillales bacterium]
MQRQEAVKPDSAPQPEAKPAEPGLGYISPVIHVDSEAGVAILQYRDKLSGDVTVQFPSETVVKRYREGEVVAHHSQSGSSETKSGSTGGETSAASAPASPSSGEGGSGGGTSTGGDGSTGGDAAA